MLNFHLNRIYLGVDIGGTKSLAWLCDSAGYVLGTGLAGAGERRGDDYSVMAQVLDDITTQATNEAGIPSVRRPSLPLASASPATTGTHSANLTWTLSQKSDSMPVLNWSTMRYWYCTPVVKAVPASR
jgi:N-acetylglucosamine kinase-like BadF-type ATPase